MTWFLRAKHWQLFLMTFAVPIILDVGTFLYMFILNLNGTKVPDVVSVLLLLAVLAMLVMIVVLYRWQWAVATILQKKLPPDVTMSVGWFKTSVIIPILYITLAVITVGSPGVRIGALSALNIPLLLLSLFCIFYGMYFTAKTIKTAELQRHVTMGDFVGEFCLIWFSPIGIWILQPRINSLYKHEPGLPFMEGSSVLDNTIRK